MSHNSRQGTHHIARNRKATFNYEISDRFEAGVVLLGTEVKSIRAGHVSLDEAYAGFDHKGELYLLGCRVAEYPWANREQHDPLRKKKLLLNKRELGRLSQATTRDGYSIVPMRLYLKNGRVKLELGLGKGKKLHDKRQTLKNRDAQREIERGLNER